ncbi:MAG: hypothetical protein GY757_27185 [bacterium]|nr:hypothetical protein [bacterium]
MMTFLSENALFCFDNPVGRANLVFAQIAYSAIFSSLRIGSAVSFFFRNRLWHSVFFFYLFAAGVSDSPTGHSAVLFFL